MSLRITLQIPPHWSINLNKKITFLKASPLLTPLPDSSEGGSLPLTVGLLTPSCIVYVSYFYNNVTGI